MQSISAATLQAKLNSNETLQLIDVRELFEHEDFNIGGTLIPLGEITQHINEIPTDIPVVVYCRKGIRSQIAIQKLMDKYPFTNLVNLIGGTEAWKRENGS